MSSHEHESGRHPVNIGHLVMGLAFLGLATVWAIVQSDAVTGEDIRWLLPVPWVLAGAAGLIATAFSARRHAVRQAGWVGASDAPTQPTETEPTETVEPTEPIEPTVDQAASEAERAEGPDAPEREPER